MHNLSTGCIKKMSSKTLHLKDRLMLKIPSGEKLRRKCRQKGIPTYMSKNKWTASSNSRKGLFVTTSQKAPKKSHKVTSPWLVKTFKENYNNIWYNSYWEEMHFNTPLVEMSYFSKGYHFFPQNANNFN